MRPTTATGDLGEKSVVGGMHNRLSKQVELDIDVVSELRSDIWFRRLWAEITRILGQGFRHQQLPSTNSPCTELDFRQPESRVSNISERRTACFTTDTRFIRPLLHSIRRRKRSSPPDTDITVPGGDGPVTGTVPPKRVISGAPTPDTADITD